MSIATTPTYITELVQKVLPKAFSTSICSSNELDEQPNLQVKLASENGENFCSTIYRVRAKYKSLEKHFVVKDMIQEIADMGSNERMMYESVLPEMEKLFSETGRTEKLSPICYLATDVPKEVFVLEDLNALGYRTADRHLGLDGDHAKILLQKIAKFHAASMVYIKQFPTEASHLQASHFANGATDEIGAAIANRGIATAIKLVEKWKNFNAIVIKMRKTIEQFDERIKMVVDPANAGIKVINHGDLWVNNFLYSYDGTKPSDVVFVDYQNCFIGSPATDLNYFLYTSVQLPLLKTHMKEFLEIYYDTLRTTLEHYNYAPIPSIEDLQVEMQRCAFMGYYAAVCELPLCCMSKEASEGFTMETFIDSAELERKHEFMYSKCERVVDTLRYICLYFNDLGVLD